jgi:hypothetical protein
MHQTFEAVKVSEESGTSMRNTNFKTWLFSMIITMAARILGVHVIAGYGSTTREAVSCLGMCSIGGNSRVIIPTIIACQRSTSKAIQVCIDCMGEVEYTEQYGSVSDDVQAATKRAGISL